MTDHLHPLSGAVKPGEIERAVWSAMIWAASNNPAFNDLPEYTDRGNSFAETEARRATARILSALSAPTSPAYEGSDAEADAISRSIGTMQTIGYAGLGERFDLEQATSHMGSASMEPAPGYGDWVRYSDYATLSARVAELEGELDALIDDIRTAQTIQSELLAEAADARDKALEEAARTMNLMLRSRISRGQAADAIRAMKGKP